MADRTEQARESTEVLVHSVRGGGKVIAASDDLGPLLVGETRDASVVTNYLPRTGTYVCWGVMDGVVQRAFVVPRRAKHRNQWTKGPQGA